MSQAETPEHIHQMRSELGDFVAELAGRRAKEPDDIILALTQTLAATALARGTTNDDDIGSTVEWIFRNFALTIEQLCKQVGIEARLSVMSSIKGGKG